jgi:hypothetical protein
MDLAVRLFVVGSATVGVILGLNYLFGDWGLIIFWSAVLAFLLRMNYIIYSNR